MNRIGRFLKQLRLDNDELLYQMAEKLEISKSLLSLVERNLRPMSETLKKKILTSYQLSNQKEKELEEIYIESKNTIDIQCKTASPLAKNVAFSLARKMNTLDYSDLKKIQEILEGKK